MTPEAALGFATLFLGLVVGPHPVELEVPSAVAAVELRLDGAEVARLAGPPWETVVDLGPRLEPHTLVAIGRDGSGIEIARARQEVNRPRETAEAELVLDLAARPPRAALHWRAGGFREPRAIALRLDGRDLEVADPREFGLPPLDLRSVHFLGVEVAFSETVVARAERVFGGTFRDDVVEELTAVPAFWRRRRAPEAGELAGALRVGDETLEVVAVEREAAEVLVVRTPTARVLQSLRRIGLQLGSERLRRRPGPPPPPPVVLPDGARLRFVFPRASAEKVRPGVLDEVVPVTPDAAPAVGGDLERLLTDTFYPEMEAPSRSARIGDAVAIAGIRAAATNRPRAVLLLVGGDVADESAHEAAEVRRFLHLLRVPLAVWRVDEPSTEGPWGDGTYVSTAGQFRDAARELVDLVEDQVIVWVQGRRAPERVEIDHRRLEGLGALR